MKPESEFHQVFGSKVWKTYGYKRQYMVWWIIQSLWIETLSTFCIRKKSCWRPNQFQR